MAVTPLVLTQQAKALPTTIVVSIKGRDLNRNLDLKATFTACDTQDGSITIFLTQAREGEQYAQTALWDRYIQQLLVLATRQLGSSAQGLVGPDDVASMAFHDLLRGLTCNRFQELGNREDLWQVLVMLVRRRSIDQRRLSSCKKRGGGVAIELCTDGEQRYGAAWFEQTISADDPTPDEALALQEEFERRMDQLHDERLKHIAACKLSGFTNREIAKKLACSERSIERKLAIIRRHWESGL